jgi:hypothetical protein
VCLLLNGFDRLYSDPIEHRGGDSDQWSCIKLV